MAKAGIGLTVALDSIGEQITTPRMRTICTMLKRDVEGGRQFSEALQRFPRVFSPLYINMVRASEMAGSFGHMLERITDYLSQQMETKRQVTGAMVYPIIIVILALLTTVFMLTFVLPRFMVLFAGKEEILPLPTKMLMAMSASLCHYWFVYLVVAAASITGTILFIRTDRRPQFLGPGETEDPDPLETVPRAVPVAGPQDDGRTGERRRAGPRHDRHHGRGLGQRPLRADLEPGAPGGAQGPAYRADAWRRAPTSRRA